ncbi:MAG: hypothetical protein WBA22_18465 [Candidatus Methanofastidiosia archaeon]
MEPVVYISLLEVCWSNRALLNFLTFISILVVIRSINPRTF